MKYEVTPVAEEIKVVFKNFSRVPPQLVCHAVCVQISNQSNHGDVS